MSDKITVEGILAKGYGFSPKLVMQDREITIEAKGIYSYFSSYAGAGKSAFPSVKKTIYDLNIGEERYYTHRKKLIEKGYLIINKQVSKDGKFNHNLYTLPSYPQNPGTDNSTSEEPRREELGTNSNSTNSNNINSNSINNYNNDFNKNTDKTGNKKNEKYSKKIAHFYEDNFGEISNYIQKELNYWVSILNNELVLESLKRSKDYGKEFGYAKRIMKNWKSLDVKTLGDVKKIDAKFIRGTDNKNNGRRESLPNWMNEDYEIPSTDKKLEDKELSTRLEKLRKERDKQ